MIIFIQVFSRTFFVRDKEFKNIGFNKKGMLQILSVLPTSYPGHNIVTEDLRSYWERMIVNAERKENISKFLIDLEKSEVRGCMIQLTDNKNIKIWRTIKFKKDF